MFKKREKKGSTLNLDEIEGKESEEKSLDSTDKADPDEKNVPIALRSKKITKIQKGVEALSNHGNLNGNGENKNEGTGLLDKEFLRQTSIEIKDRNMEKFIEEKMMEQRGIFKKPENRTQTAGEMLLDLEREVITLHNASTMSRKLAEEAREKTYWASGMAEVHVSLDEKIRNIEEAEKAKMNVLNNKPFVLPALPKVNKKELDKETKKMMKTYEKKFMASGRAHASEKFKKAMENRLAEVKSQNV